MAGVRVVVGSVVAVVLLAVAVVAGAVALGAARDAGDASADDAGALGSAIPADLFDSLRDERNYASVYVIGAEEAIAVPVDSFAEAKDRTDAALRTFRADVDRAGGRTAGAFAPALDRIDGRIDTLRAEVDGLTGPRGLNGELDNAQSLYQDYTSLIDGLLAADQDVTTGIDDPSVRRGAALMGLANRQDVVMGLLARELLLDAVDPDGNGLLDTPEEISSAAAHLARWRQGDTQIDRLATGAFRPAAERLLATPEIGDLQDAIDESILTAQVRLFSDGTFVQALAGDHDAPYATFRRDVAAVLADQADRRATAAIADRNRAALVMVAALALAVLVAAVTVGPAITRAQPQAKVDQLV